MVENAEILGPQEFGDDGGQRDSGAEPFVPLVDAVTARPAAHNPALPAGPVSAGPGQFRSTRPRPPKLYRIGEVVDYSGLSRQTVHNYTTMGLLHESRWTNGGHRLYDESVFERLDRIAEMRARHCTLDHIREYFSKQDLSSSGQAAEVPS